jgi:hypothetical protein
VITESWALAHLRARRSGAARSFLREFSLRAQLEILLEDSKDPGVLLLFFNFQVTETVDLQCLALPKNSYVSHWPYVDTVLCVRGVALHIVMSHHRVPSFGGGWTPSPDINLPSHIWLIVDRSTRLINGDRA